MNVLTIKELNEVAAYAESVGFRHQITQSGFSAIFFSPYYDNCPSMWLCYEVNPLKRDEANIRIGVNDYVIDIKNIGDGIEKYKEIVDSAYEIGRRLSKGV